MRGIRRPIPARVVVFRVWAKARERGTCRHCQRPIVWLFRVDDGRRLPVDPDYTIRDQQIHEQRQQPFGYVVGADVHSCPEWKQARARAAQPPSRGLF